LLFLVVKVHLVKKTMRMVARLQTLWACGSLEFRWISGLKRPEQADVEQRFQQ
jgi:hypothetical protein